MKRRILVSALAVLILVLTVSVAMGTDDPLITESYLNEVFFKTVKEYIAENASGTGSSFSVLNIKKGQKFIGGAGCEFILRQGKAEIFATELGGLSDVTAGFDLTTGAAVPANHLLIIPRDDGRGFTALNEVIIMVKGKYSVK